MSSPLHQLAQKFISGFDIMSADRHTSLRTPDCIHIFAPSSLNMKPQTNTTFTEHLNELKKIVKAFPVTAKEIHIHDSESKKQIVIWATAIPEFREEVIDLGEKGKEEWEYEGEYIFILDVVVDEGGELKIERVVEFLDSLKTQGLFGLGRRARAKLEALKG